MASTSYLARVIYREHSNTNETWAGTYNLMVKAKSIPSPVSAPNTVESTTLEDDTQTFEMGIKTADSREVTGNLEKEYLDNLDSLSGQKLDIIHLYGTQGIGEVAKYAYVGQVTATPNDVGGVDEILEMTATIVPNTAAVKISDDYTVTDNGNGTFTVTEGSVNPDIVLNKSNLALTVGNSSTLTATTKPSGQTVTWNSNDTDVATVSNGTVTAIGAGSATITAQITVDGNNYTDTCAVTVTAGV